LRILGSEDRSFVFFGLVLPIRRRSSVVCLLALLRSPSNSGTNNHLSEPTTSAKAWMEVSGGGTATRTALGGVLRPGLDVEEGAEAGDQETGEKGCDKEACAMVGLVVAMVRLVEMYHHQDRT
jgi:hypothetical protein